MLKRKVSVIGWSSRPAQLMTGICFMRLFRALCGCSFYWMLRNRATKASDNLWRLWVHLFASTWHYLVWFAGILIPMNVVRGGAFLQSLCEKFAGQAWDSGTLFVEDVSIHFIYKLSLQQDVDYLTDFHLYLRRFSSGWYSCWSSIRFTLRWCFRLSS